MNLTQAVVLAGGIGSKLLPMTQVIAKEMLPIAARPILEHVILELVAAGVTRILVVTRRGKHSISDFFCSGRKWGANIAYLVQEDAGGPAEGILLAEEWVNDAPFVLAFGDNIVETKIDTTMSPVRRLRHAFQLGHHDSAVLVDSVPVEKLTPDHTVLVPRWSTGREALPSEGVEVSSSHIHCATDTLRYAMVCCARWILNGKVFPYLRSAVPRKDGERYLIDQIPRMLHDGTRLLAIPLKKSENVHNLDVWDRYTEASVYFGVATPPPTPSSRLGAN